MIRRLVTFAAALCVLTPLALANPSGTWRTQEGNTGGYALVRIAACSDGSGNYCGTIVDIVGNDNRSSVGRPIITSMEDRGEGSYTGGWIWAPDEDKWYRSKMQLSGSTLRVSGCVAGGLICRSQNWTRVN